MLCTMFYNIESDNSTTLFYNIESDNSKIQMISSLFAKLLRSLANPLSPAHDGGTSTTTLETLLASS